MQLHAPSVNNDPITEENLEKWRRQCPSIRVIPISDKGFLYRQGTACPYVFLLSKGIVKISCLTEQGSEWTIALLRRGDIIGCLQSHAADEAMPETAQAVGEATVIRVEHHEFIKLVTEQPALLWQAIETQYARRQRAERKLINILAQPVENRILDLLKELAEVFGKRCTHGYSLEIRLTQQELADLVGASRPVVSTIMNELRGRGLLDYTRDLICVKDELFAYSTQPS
jgi:CRP/FNR family cyclic AMP-dependent transcriptional regulator